jgi:hypothetical protein
MSKKYAWLLVLSLMFVLISAADAKAQTLKSEAGIPCKIIRTVHYPVTQTEPSKQPLRIALLNLCPADPGMEQRPMFAFLINNETVMREYVVEKVFKDAKEAKKYAKKNKIKDVSF